jgi:hypothetical protein
MGLDWDRLQGLCCYRINRASHMGAHTCESFGGHMHRRVGHHHRHQHDTLHSSACQGGVRTRRRTCGRGPLACRMLTPGDTPPCGAARAPSCGAWAPSWALPSWCRCVGVCECVPVLSPPAHADGGSLDATRHAQPGEQTSVFDRGARARDLLTLLGPGDLCTPHNLHTPHTLPCHTPQVAYMDPGNWATAIEAGSRFGYQLVRRRGCQACCMLPVLRRSCLPRQHLGVCCLAACRHLPVAP